MGGLENNRELTWIFISLGNAPLFCCNFIFLNENCFPVDTFWGNTDKESTTSSSSTTGCNTSGCLSIWKLTVLCRFFFFCTPFFSSPSSVSPWLTGWCVWDGTGHKMSMTRQSLPPELSWTHFGIAARWGIYLRSVFWKNATLLFIIFYIFLSSNVYTTWAANFIVFSFLSVFLSSNVCITWAAMFPAPSFFQRYFAVFPSAFLLACSSLTSCIISSHISSSVGL